MFRTEALRQRIELINHLIEFARQIILIQGPTGFGKSALLNAIEESANKTWVFIRINAGPTLNRESLLGKISAHLDFEPTEKFSEEEVCAEILRRLEILDRTKQIAVLMIDDAQELPSDTYSLLLSLAHNDEASAELRIVLAADNTESSLLDNLQTNSSQQALIHSVDMPRMDRDQTASLLSWWQDQQLNPSDETNVPKFSSAIIDEIFTHSEGVPGTILTLARQHRLSGSNVPLRSDPAKKYIAFGVGALLVITLIAFFGKEVDDSGEQDLTINLPDEIPADISDATNNQAPMAAVEGPLANPIAPAGTEVVEQEPVARPASEEIHTPSSAGNKLGGTISSTNAPLALEPANDLDSMLAAALVEQVLPTPSTVTITKAPAMEAQPPNANPDEAVKVEIKTTSEPSKADSRGEKPTVPNVSPKVSDGSKISIKIRQRPVPPVKDEPTAPKQITKAPPVVAATTAPLPTAAAPEYALANLLRDQPNGYVLQLFGVRDHSAAVKYIENNGLANKSTIVASMHEGQPWYVVIFGQFASRADATVAAKDLAKTLPQINPWPRPVSSLK